MAIPTKILVLSDTHGKRFPPDRQLPTDANVVLHCGDFTVESKIDEFKATLDVLKSIGAPLTLVIAGNHDFTFDISAFHRKVTEAGLGSEQELVAREYGRDGDARQLFDDARETHNIHLLDEGTHSFTLNNGASFTVYASPFTTSLDADWGFQYRPEDGHVFDIPDNTEIVLTHSPPEGILDRMASGKRGGVPDLFKAVARARPLLHCFGHVHAGWGAKLVSWRDTTATTAETASHFTAIDNGKSTVIETLANFKRGRFDDDATAKAKEQHHAEFAKQGCRPTSHVSGDDLALEPGKQTLFVNAANMGDDDELSQLSWLVTLELPLSQSHATED